MVNELIHFGVKGMRWGVRKQREVSQKGKGYSIDKDGRIEIGKGFRLQRIFKAGSQDSGESGSNYFSFTEKDNKIYLAMLGAGAFSKIGFIKKLASNTMSKMVAKETLKSPSRKEAFDILNQVLKDSKQKGFKGNFEDRGALDWYKEQNARIVKSKDSLTFKLFKESLRKSGFNILLDEADSGFLSELPILVLDGKASLKKLSIRDFSKEELDSAADFVRNRSAILSLEDIIKSGN